MFKRFDDLIVWYRDKKPYSRYTKGKLEDYGEFGIVFKPDNGGYEIWNPTLDCLFIDREVKKQ